MIYVGIDPGKSGGVAWVDGLGLSALAKKTPASLGDIWDLFKRGPRPARAVIEFVHSSPQMGVKSAFTFGEGYGAWLMALTAARIPYSVITPRRWQTALGCLSGGDKNVTKARAQALFPALTITHAIADALLIAEYCRRIHTRGLYERSYSKTAGTSHRGAERRG